METRLPATCIHRIAIFPMGMINAFLLVNPAGCVLVDTGLPGTEQKVARVLKDLGLDFADIKLIVITHAHIDHAGNAATLKALTGAPLLAHRGDLPYFQGEKPMHFCSTGWFGRLFRLTGAIQKPYARFKPDILLANDDHFSLREFGVDGDVFATPGHTEGSISVLVDTDKAVVGDLISSGVLLGGILRTGKAKRPPFEDNPLQVSEELKAIASQGAETFFMGHGGPLPQEEVLAHASRLKTVR